jgi:hypothetical protein
VPLSEPKNDLFLKNKAYITYKLVFELKSKGDLKAFEDIIDAIVSKEGHMGDSIDMHVG